MPIREQSGFFALADRAVFGNRHWVLALFTIVTLFMLYMSTQIHVAAGFEKQLPLQHPYMKVFKRYQSEFGGANRLLVALIAEDGNMFTPAFFKALETLTQDVSHIDGVNQSSTSSIFTPDVRFIEVVEGGFSGGNVIPSNFAPQSKNFNPSQADFEHIKANIVKAGIVGRLVAEDFSGAMVWADLLETDPTTGKKVDYQRVAAQLNELRERYDNDAMSVHVLGFAQIIGDIADGAKSVVRFFGVAILITAMLLFWYSGSWRLAALPLICSIVAVVWGLGALELLGFGIDPMNILTPFLVFAIGVSHGVQMINSWNDEMVFGAPQADQQPVNALVAARRTFRRLLVPGSIALVSDVVGFLTILLINIRIIQELAITASIGVAFIIFTNLLLLPVLLSFLNIRDLDSYRARLKTRLTRGEGLWRRLSHVTRTGPAAATVVIGALLFWYGFESGKNLDIGDSQTGVPELREDARFNRDARLISSKFSLGVDQLSVIAEADRKDACTEDFKAMQTIDDFAWHIENVEGVQRVITLPYVARLINSGWNEGSPKWRVIARDTYAMRQNLQHLETSTGLMNRDCDAMPVIIFTTDHRAATIDRIIAAIADYQVKQDYPGVHFRLATGNVGVMAATNQVVSKAQLPILGWVYGAILLLCVVTFRSFAATVCIVAPLAIVSALSYALMAYLGIGLKVNTLPVVALGVGIGVDYGIYIYTRMHSFIRHGATLTEAYYQALTTTGKPVLFTAVTLAVGVSTWLFSALKFQADMGVLLTFMFLLNMVGAILLLPALARFILPAKHSSGA